jgi:hypothetical protein
MNCLLPSSLVWSGREEDKERVARMTKILLDWQKGMLVSPTVDEYLPAASSYIVVRLQENIPNTPCQLIVPLRNAQEGASLLVDRGCDHICSSP